MAAVVVANHKNAWQQLSSPQPEIHRADDDALEVLLGGGCPLCEPKSPQKAGKSALQTTLGGGRPLCEIWVGARVWLS